MWHTYPAYGCSWSLTSYYPWSLDLLVHVPFSTPRGAYGHVALVTCRTAIIVISVPPCTYLHLSEVENLRVKCIAQGRSNYCVTPLSLYNIYINTHQNFAHSYI